MDQVFAHWLFTEGHPVSMADEPGDKRHVNILGEGRCQPCASHRAPLLIVVYQGSLGFVLLPFAQGLVLEAQDKVKLFCKHSLELGYKLDMMVDIWQKRRYSVLGCIISGVHRGPDRLLEKNESWLPSRTSNGLITLLTT